MFRYKRFYLIILIYNLVSNGPCKADALDIVSLGISGFAAYNSDQCDTTSKVKSIRGASVVAGAISGFALGAGVGVWKKKSIVKHALVGATLGGVTQTLVEAGEKKKLDEYAVDLSSSLEEKRDHNICKIFDTRKTQLVTLTANLVNDIRPPCIPVNLSKTQLGNDIEKSANEVVNQLRLCSKNHPEFKPKYNSAITKLYEFNQSFCRLVVEQVVSYNIDKEKEALRNNLSLPVPMLTSTCDNLDDWTFYQKEIN